MDFLGNYNKTTLDSDFKIQMSKIGEDENSKLNCRHTHRCLVEREALVASTFIWPEYNRTLYFKIRGSADEIWTTR